MNGFRRTNLRGWATGLITPFVLLASTVFAADDPPKKPAPAPAKPAAAAAHPAAGAAGAAASHLPGASHAPAATPNAAGHPATPAAGGAAHPGTPGTAGGANHAGAPGGVARPGGAVPNGRAGGVAPGNHPAGFSHPGPVQTGRNGTQFQRDTRGNVREIHRGDLAVHRGPGGSIRSERVLPNGSRLVGYRNGGYVEHGYRYGGREIYTRNYYYGGRSYSRVYNPYMYRGFALNVYAPSYYYAPAFYGYAYAPWGAPVAFSWGFAGSPWYGYYGGYFTPYPVYASPSLWLTDYLVSQSLQNAYQQQQAAGQGQPQQQQQAYDTQPAPLTPEVKQQIADEVRRQIALENSERAQATAPNSMPDPASSGVARMLGDNATHVFVASAPLNLVSGGGECPITEGDVLQLSGAPAPNATSANAVVLASKGQDCAKGSIVQVAFGDLQDMQNHMRETIDQGMGELQKKQGTEGLPAMPASAVAPPTEAPYAAIAPPPDPAEATEVTKQVQDASQAEQDALAGALGGPSDAGGPSVTPGATPAPSTVSMGQSKAEVEAIMGKPKSIANLPTKTIYVYDGLKVVFVNGKVSDVQ